MSGENATRMPPRALPVVIAAIVGVLYAAGSLAGWGGTAFITWAEAGAAGAAAISLLVSAGRPRGGDGDGASGLRRLSAGGIWRASLRWYGIAAACWFLGAVGSALADYASRSALSLSVPDLFYLLAVVALVIGLVVPVSPPRDVGTWLRYAADTYVCVCGLFVLGWVAVFSTLYHRSGESPAEFLLELLYPLIDIALVCGALPFVLGAARGHRRPAWMGYGALAAFAIADIVTTFVRLHGGAPAEDPADILRLAGLLLLMLVPWTEPAPEPTDDIPPDAEVVRADEPEVPRGRMIGPGIAPAAVAAAAALFIAGHTLTGRNGMEPVVPLVAGSATLVLLARLAALLHENDRLRREVDAGEQHFRALSESIDGAVLICDMDATVQYASAGALRTYHYSAEELVGRPLHELIHPEDLPRLEEVFTEFLEAEDDPSGEDALRVSCRVRAADGTWLPTESTVSRYSGGASGRLLVTSRDLSEQAALQRQVAHLTFHDGLTGLPNRSFFEERTRELLSRQESGDKIAAVFVDLDGFTDVNDSAGHAAGDQVLAQAARRLRGNVLADDTVARWGGDEFAVLVQLPSDERETQATVELAGRLLRVLSADPYQVGGKQIALTASVGIAFAGDDERPGGGKGSDTGRRVRRSAADLLRNGDLAMARAKEMGGGRVEVYAPHMHADVVRRLELGSDLQRALAEEQFAVEFQPVVDLATSRVTSVEALLRWWRGSEAVPPEEFIGPAEEAGLMPPLGDWVLREACREVARWREDSWEIGLSVNFTARQIGAPRFVETVAAVLDETGLPPHALTLEVREEVLVDDGTNVERLEALRDLGVRLAIDDFGTGYASLAYLGRLPVDVIKIDPSFVAGLGTDETSTLLTRTIVRLGSDLGLTVVAEGIERPEQLELLREMGCPRGQGYLVARPMAAGRVESLVRTNLAGGGDDVSGEIPLPLPG